MGSGECLFQCFIHCEGQSHKDSGFKLPLLQSNVALRPQRPQGLLGTPLPRTATSTFTQLLSSETTTLQTLLYIHRNHKAYMGWGVQDGHLDFHTAPELRNHNFSKCCFTSTETIKLIMDGEPMMVTSTFTQFLSSVCIKPQLYLWPLLCLAPVV